MVELKTKAGCLALVVLVLAVFNLCPRFARADGPDAPVIGQCKARARQVKGIATYTKEGVSAPLQEDTELPAGTTITTGSNSMVDLIFDDPSSVEVIRLQADSTFVLAAMNKVGEPQKADTFMAFELKTGSMLGHVKLVSEDSRFEVKLPKTIIGTRGKTDFAVRIKGKKDEQRVASITCVKGTVIDVLKFGSVLITTNLHDGESITQGEFAVHATPPDELAEDAKQIKDAISLMMKPQAR